MTVIFNIGLLEENDMYGLMALFLNFNLIRGSHSDLEVVWAFNELKKYYNKLESLMSIVKDGVINFNKGRLSENLLLGFKSDIDKLRFRLC